MIPLLIASVIELLKQSSYSTPKETKEWIDFSLPVMNPAREIYELYLSIPRTYPTAESDALRSVARKQMRVSSRSSDGINRTSSFSPLALFRPLDTP
jgi:hypothetical protein